MKACFISSVECSILWEVLRFTFTFIWLCKYMVLLQNSQSHSTVPYLKSPTCFLLSLLLYCFTRMSALCPHWNLKSWRPVCTILSGTTQNLQDSYWLLSTSQWFLAPLQHMSSICFLWLLPYIQLLMVCLLFHLCCS